MKPSQHDYEARKGRQGTKHFTDEDARLVRLYEDSGYRPASGGPVNDPNSPEVVDADAEAGAGDGEGANDGVPTSRYADLSFADLKAEAKRRDVSTSGGQAAIVARLEEADAAKAANTGEGDAPAE